ncbi:hypothetical protein SMACR_00140 [Sordaria macrospora]|uniref:WGS project CABT00000000 data, contig 2.1 n=2 Tax=Sordaria macrospora TaxID=5147 RepID=F7VK98_SORMK|nr:uncharacterized protein SMAC_00140 [Sordaria macrospora k-hell]KAA8629588.1 hypothetical protein SMACR_00140 [Sordaria macrospora]CCC05925.1 unnamed protein product [Sordaria macrospora k-hell]
MSGLAAPLSSASLEHPGKTSSYSSDNVSGRSSTYGQAEEATIYTETRMLQDQTGRLPPQPGSREDEIVKKLYSTKQDMAELFFRSAKSMCDPEYGFEDADFWSIQALCLMTVYMLTVSKRNTAYAYLGMAVRSAYALGLHREETMHPLIYPESTQREVRRNLWKTLFILDRFLAASLGRPVAIVEDDCSCKLTINDDIADLSTVGENGSESLHFGCLDACVKSCRVIGVTLRVFSKRKISTAVVQDIANMAKYWRRPSLSNLTPQQSREGPTSPEQGIAALHANLLSLHSLILLTRQIFIMHNWKLDQQRSGKANPPSNRESHMVKFSEACVVASYQTIHLIQQAREDGYLPRRNPFIIYFLFAASLIVLMNQFASLYYADKYIKTITDAISTMKYCAEIDPQAERFSHVTGEWQLSSECPQPFGPSRLKNRQHFTPASYDLTTPSAATESIRSFYPDPFNHRPGSDHERNVCSIVDHSTYGTSTRPTPWPYHSLPP